MTKDKDEIILKILTLNDLFIWGSWFLVQPFISIWAVETIPNVGTAQIGIATMLYTIMPAIINKPLGNLLDNIKGYTDESIALSIGGIISGIAIISLRFADTVGLYYLLEAIIGFGLAVDVISWRILFTHNINQQKAGAQWSSYGIAMSIGLSLAVLFGGYITEFTSYNTLFLVAGITTVLGGVIPNMLIRLSK
jgi:sugar phosphate permease